MPEERSSGKWLSTTHNRSGFANFIVFFLNVATFNNLMIVNEFFYVGSSSH